MVDAAKVAEVRFANCFKGLESKASFINQEIEDYSKGIREIKNNHFKFFNNVLFYILIGGLIFLMAFGVLKFMDEKNGYIKDLAKKSALESIKKEAVEDYKKTLIGERSGIIRIKELELKWACDSNNVNWENREEAINSYKKELQWAKERFSN